MATCAVGFTTQAKFSVARDTIEPLQKENERMTGDPLHAVALELVSGGRGLLAADESLGTANRRFAPLGIPQTEEMRRAYREVLFTTPDLGRYISGVILFDETIRQSRRDGVSFVRTLQDAGMIPGIKPDKGTVDLALHPGEHVTEGLDGLAPRVAEYAQMGAKFAKWRAIIEIGPGTPTDAAIAANAMALARYAAICQAGGLVPIVEAEVLMDGGRTHTLEQSFVAHERTLEGVFLALAKEGVVFERMLLKPSMVIPGERSSEKATPNDVATATVRCFKRWVPAAVPGIAFLSGGQTPEQATANLNEINRIAPTEGAPWPLTFSFSRALQEPALAAWKGNDANAHEAQAELLKRARLASLAASGKYDPQMESEPILAGVS
jgi:fructose-bisphosphate aldolase, class I